MSKMLFFVHTMKVNRSNVFWMPMSFKSSQVRFIYIALYKIQISKQLPSNIQENNSINIANFLNYEMHTISALNKP